MKKIISLFLVFASVTYFFVGCKETETPCDTSKYTREDPFIEENFVITEDTTRLPFDNYYYHWQQYETSEQYFDSYVKNSEVVVCAVKDSSDSYYWEEDGEKILYTVTEMKITRKISGMGGYYNSLNVGDTVKILEYYSVDPNGCFMTHYYRFSDADYTEAINYMMLGDRGQWAAHPFVKSDTEYFMHLNIEFLINSEDKKVSLPKLNVPEDETSGNGRDFFKDFYYIPHENIEGVFCYAPHYELSESAYNKAKQNLSQYEDISAEKFTDSAQVYDRRVIYIREDLDKYASGTL